MKPLEATCVMDDGTACTGFTLGDPSSCPDSCTYIPSLCVSNLGSTECGLPQYTQLNDPNWVNVNGTWSSGPALQCTFDPTTVAPIWDSSLGEYKDPVSGTNRDVNQICPGPQDCSVAWGDTCNIPPEITWFGEDRDDVSGSDALQDQCKKVFDITYEEKDINGIKVNIMIIFELESDNSLIRE